MRINYNRLNREIRMDKVSKIVEFFKTQGYKFETKNYNMLNNMARLNLIADTIERISPGYRQSFRKFEEKKPESKQIELEYDFDLHEVIESAEGIPTTEKALEIFYSNNIAHTCRDAQKKMLGDMLKEKNKENAGYESLMYHFNSKEIDQIAKLAQRYFIAQSNMNTRVVDIAKRQLSRFGISIDEIETLRERGYDVLAKGYVDCMAIKVEAVDKVVDLLKEDKTQSFGLAKIVNRNTGKEESLFVMDVPCFGQMSVHILAPIYDEKLITTLTEHEYKYPICNIDNVLLIDRASEYQESFMLQDTPELIESLRKLKSRKEAHEIAVKAGFEKDELEMLYQTNEEGDER